MYDQNIDDSQVHTQTIRKITKSNEINREIECDNQ